MSTLSKIKNLKSLVPIAGKLDFWTYTDSTPSSSFTYYLRELPSSDCIVATVCKSGCSVEMAKQILAGNEDELISKLSAKHLVLTEQSGINRFEIVVTLSPESHDLFKTFDPSIHQNTIVAFPAYKCEFSGRENGEFVRLVRKEIVPTLEWGRAPAPQILARMNNPKTKVKSIGKGKFLEKLPQALSFIMEMADCEGSWIELQNVTGNVMMIQFKGRFKIEYPEGVWFCDKSFDAIRVAKSFALLLPIAEKE